MAEFVPLYHGSFSDAQEYDAVSEWSISHAENVRCRDYISQSISMNYDGARLGGDVAEHAIAMFGYDRVNWVLATTIQQSGDDGQISAGSKAWAEGFYIPRGESERDYRQDFVLRNSPELVDLVARDTRQAWDALRLFDKSHCLPFSEFQNVTGHLLVLKPTALKESCRTPENQVFLAELGAGTVPTARGRMIGGRFLFDGEFAKFNREDFIGALKPDHFPEWAAEKMREPEPEQAPEPTHIRVFQIDKDRDVHGRCFMPLEPGQAVDPSIYDEVYSGPVPDADPEAIFQQFNVNKPPLHRGWSMSVSDVVEVGGKYLYVDNFGFEEIPFDASLTQKPDGLCRVVAIDPGYPAYEAEVGPDLQSMQRAVGGGLIEVTYPFDDNAVMVGNEEAKLIDMPGNRRIGGGVYAGPLFIIGDDGEGGFCSLTDAQVEGYCQEFAVPEDITMEEVQADVGMRFYGWG